MNEPGKKSKLYSVLWATAVIVSSIYLLLMIISFLFGGGEENCIQSPDVLICLLFLAGYIIAFWRPGLGGLLIFASAVLFGIGFVLWLDYLAGLYLHIPLAIAGILFMISCWLKIKSKTNS